MKKILMLAVLVVCLAAQAAVASVAIDMYVADIRAHTGAVVPDSAIGLMVVDTSGGLMATLGNGLAPDSSLAYGSYITNTNGQNVGKILGKWRIAEGTGVNGQLVAPAPAFILGGDVTSGRPIYFMWFESLTMASTSPGYGTWYGIFRDPTEAPNMPEIGDWRWEVPPDGFGGIIGAFTVSTELGTFPDSALTAMYRTIPEPSTALLVGAGLLGLVAIRRRR